MFLRLDRLLIVGIGAACSAHGATALAWGDEGHRIIGIIAYAHLDPPVRAKVDFILRGDEDTLTAPDFVSRTTWADHYRDSDRLEGKSRYLATRAWHFVDVELDGGSLADGCRAAESSTDAVASKGPADDCVVHKIDQFSSELADAHLPIAEKRLALKFLMHFVGDVHQPLHAADNHDRGGNAVPVVYDALATSSNLHSYWDARLVAKLGWDASRVGASLNRKITTDQTRSWSFGSAAQWAKESFQIAKTIAYDFGGEQTFVSADGTQGFRLDATYDARAMPVVREQLSKAGIRLAAVLNHAMK
jgi:hypothetical protein